MNRDSRRIQMMLHSKSRLGSNNDSGKRRNSSIISKTISASKLCRCDALGSQIDNNALVSIERKSSVKHSSKNRTDRRVVMQEQMEKLEEDLRETREELDFVEGEKNKAINELKQVVHKANMKASDEITQRKSSELYGEVRTLKELLTNKQEELKMKDKNIKCLKLELEKAKRCDVKISEKDVSLGKVKEGSFSPVKTFKIRVTDWLSDFKRKVQELEDELENKKLSESKIFDAWLTKTRQFEEIKIKHEESMLEIASLNEKIESLDTCYNGEIINSEFALAKENEKIVSSKALNDELSLLKKEMKLANEAEEKSRKALDDLALALKEVSFEASEAKKETELYRNTAERLKVEADESLSAWNGKEMSFIACIKEVQEERDLALHEVTKLNESVKEAEQRSKATRDENYKLRDILKQAINEANAAGAAADLARRENSQLKDCLAKTR